MADGTPGMHPRTVPFAWLGIAVGAAAVWFAPPAPTMTRHGPVLPLAALAWARLNCDAALTKENQAATIHAEDLRRVGAYFDGVRATAGAQSACHAATRAAASAITDNAASYRTEVLVSVALPVR